MKATRITTKPNSCLCTRSQLFRCSNRLAGHVGSESNFMDSFTRSASKSTLFSPILFVLVFKDLFRLLSMEIDHTPFIDHNDELHLIFWWWFCCKQTVWYISRCFPYDNNCPLVESKVKQVICLQVSLDQECARVVIRCALRCSWQITTMTANADDTIVLFYK